MFALLLCAQLATVDTTRATPYASPALRALVAAAAAAGVPRDISGYRATLETDVAVLQPDEQGREHAVQLEQLESRLSWQRDSALVQHVVGYRARGGLTVSALTLLRRPWVVPTLYGDRLRLLLGSRALEGAAVGSGGVTAVHPFASDRDAVYRFAGGDTVLVVRERSRRVTLVRVRVSPRADLHELRTPLLVFRGDIDVDAERKQIVHLRGELLTVSRPSLLTRARRAVLRRQVFVDIANAEFDGRWWLPTYERVDVQARSGLSEGFRPGIRVVTRFRDHEVDTLPRLGEPVDGRLTETGHGAADQGRLTFAPNDSLDAFGGWHDEIGASATGVAATDFDDLARAAAPRRARPVPEWRAERLSDVFRYDKIEGIYTGVAGVLPLRADDSTTTLMLATHAGWSWADATTRGGAALRWRRGAWRGEVSARRELENTSDFLPPLEGPATFGALLASVDDYDYVDRAAGTLTVSRALDDRASHLVRVEVGPGRDAAVRDHVARGLVQFDSTFRPNRPVTPGSYLREAVAFTVNPGVSGDFLEPGLGYSLSYARGDAGLRWQRLDGELAARHTVGRVTYAGRVVGAAVFGGAPYQQLVEFGENEGMPGYGYKAFGGDRAALGRVAVSYQFARLQAPLRLRRWLTLPGPTPAITVSLQGGWAESVAAETRRAFEALGSVPGPDGTLVPRTRPTGGVRSSVAVAFDLFGGAVGVGVAHPLGSTFDRGGWRLILGSQAW